MKLGIHYVNINAQHSYKVLLNCFKSLTSYQKEIIGNYKLLIVGDYFLAQPVVSSWSFTFMCNI